LTLIVTGLVVLAFLVYIDRLNARHVAELEQLLNRIQAPQLAVAQSLADESDGPRYVPLDDDAAFYAAKER
jgi:hypothetical protein